MKKKNNKTNKKEMIRPLADRVILEPLSPRGGNKTESGIIIPETVDRERPEKGRVIEVGPGRMSDEGRLIPVSVKKGQVVVFKSYSADEVKLGDKEYLVLSEGSILAVIEE